MQIAQVLEVLTGAGAEAWHGSTDKSRDQSKEWKGRRKQIEAVITRQIGTKRGHMHIERVEKHAWEHKAQPGILCSTLSRRIPQGAQSMPCAIGGMGLEG